MLISLVQKNSRWDESIALSKQDRLYKDAMITASVSGSTEVAEELLSYFVDIGTKECFSALLYICFDLLRSDIVEELSWQHGLNDFYMPYKIQVQRSLVTKVRFTSDKLSIGADLDSTAGSAGKRGQGAVEEGCAKGAGGS
jgi:clathrin heavy chain